MTHFTDDELVLLFYGEHHREDAARQHLANCAACAALFADISDALTLVVPAAVPERNERYGLEVWQRVRPLLGESMRAGTLSTWGWSSLWRNGALAGAVAAMIVAAFFAGRAWPHRGGAANGNGAGRGETAAVSAPAGASDRVRLAAIGDHLEQSERLLLDFVNAGGQVVDVTPQQALAAELVDANRIFREAATGAGDAMIADVLDALERSLIEIAHGPSTLSPNDFRKMRLRLDAAALLFKVRVLSDELHDREVSDRKPLKTT
jgi:hypothetical protein